MQHCKPYRFHHLDGGEGLDAASYADRPGDLVLTFEEFAERNFYRLYLHEIGHALGLRHPHDQGNNFEDDVIQKTVMSHNFHKDDPWPATPMIADINAVKTLWGSKSEMGDNIYQLLEVRKYDGSVMSISDNGGHDRIDINHSTTGAIIDIQSGSASKVESGTNNVFIHKDTVYMAEKAQIHFGLNQSMKNTF